MLFFGGKMRHHFSHPNYRAIVAQLTYHIEQLLREHCTYFYQSKKPHPTTNKDFVICYSKLLTQSNKFFYKAIEIDKKGLMFQCARYLLEMFEDYKRV